MEEIAFSAVTTPLSALLTASPTSVSLLQHGSVADYGLISLCSYR
jgi:hypothetical protein